MNEQEELRKAYVEGERQVISSEQVNYVPVCTTRYSTTVWRLRVS